MSTLDELLALRERGGLLGRLGDADLRGLAGEVEEVSCSAGEPVFRRGEALDRLLILLQGRVELENGEDQGPQAIWKTLEPGDVLGAVALSTGGVAGRGARCVEDCRFAALSHDAFNRLLETFPDCWRALQELALDRMRREQLAVHLDKLFGPFGRLLPFVLEELEDEVEWLTLRSGDTLYDEGDPAEHAYVLMSGRLLVATRSEDGVERNLSTVLPGETVGEVGLLTDRDRSVTVYAGRDSELARLSRHSFELMLQRSSRAMFKVSRLLVNRLAHRRTEDEADRAPIRGIALLPARPEVDVGEVGRMLREDLSAQGPVELLSSRTVDRELGTPGISQAKESEPAHLRLGQWLQEREAARRYLIYQADPTWTPWTERCARQADHVTVVAEAGDPPDLGDLESRLRRPRLKWSLLLLHPPETERPRDTARWLEALDADTVLHMRKGHAADQARVARLLTGRAIGLVLGGGGARGFAHVGVLKAMEELGIPVDMVGGTSIGAILAFYVARGMSAEAIKARLKDRWGSLTDFTFPVVSLMAGQRIDKAGRDDTSTWDLEDLWLPFFCVVTNLTTSQEEVHRRGDAFHPIRSSLSIPGVLPPMLSGREMLVDGGVLNNLPIDVMREQNPYGKVLAIDVVSPRGIEAKTDYGKSTSGWSLLLRKILPWAKTPRLPGLANILMTTTMVGASRARQEMLQDDLADFYHNIHVRGVGLLEFDKVDKSVELGYRDSIDALREWSRSGAAPSEKDG